MAFLVHVNNAAIVSDTFYSGNAAMRFHAETNQPNGVSSSALNSNENLFLREEMVFSVDCRIMIPSYSSSNNLEIMRLEANDSADDPSGVSFFLDEDGALSLNRSAMGLSNIHQEIGTKTAFPTNQWVNVHIDYLADARSRGYVKIWQDEVLVLEALSTETMPKAKLHLSEKGKNYFSKLSFGILSNGSGLPTTLFLGRFKRLELGLSDVICHRKTAFGLRHGMSARSIVPKSVANYQTQQ
jgi:hypothetical protein